MSMLTKFLRVRDATRRGYHGGRPADLWRELIARHVPGRSSRHKRIGLDSSFDPTRGYGNWVWLPTPSCLRAMMLLAGFAVREFYPSRRVTTVVAVPSDEPLWVSPSLA